ncbi:MAG: UPF0261 family protein, partial [Planctomycetota bacterium]
MTVFVIATLDTKGREAAFVRDRIAAAGLPVQLVDVGCLGRPQAAPDVTRQTVYAHGGVSLKELQQARDRGRAVEAAARAAAAWIRSLHGQAAVEGVLGLGGSAGTTIATAAMRALPLGIPKLMVSTLASGQTRPFVGEKDIMMLHSVVDILGLNRISRSVLARAADAMIGMVRGQMRQPAGPTDGDRPLVAATMFGVTTPCVEAAQEVLEQAGYEVLVFHATGTGGRTMESLIRDGWIAGVLDITTTELADELVGGVLSAGPDRLTAAAESGGPQVVSVGALDMVNFGPRDTVPERFRERRFYQHNPNVTLMRTTIEENRALGRIIAERTNAARGPVAVLLPARGVSAIDAAGQPFDDPQARAALFEEIRKHARRARIVELDHHINDREFAVAAARELLRLMTEAGERSAERPPASSTDDPSEALE